MKLLSPLKGWATPLDEVPDEVFAGRMLGDGMAIDPTEGLLRAPCDGTVIGLARTLHAVTLRSDEGADILIHIGLETVALDGAGFTPKVTDGQRVKAGDALIAFDLDLLARRAKSLITPILITNSDAFQIAWKATDCEIESGAPLLELTAVGEPANREIAEHVEEHRHTVLLGLPHGLHARPAGRLAALARPFAATVTLIAGERTASALSPTALMTLGAARGSELVLTAHGSDAAAALAALAAFLASDGGEAADAPASTPSAPPRPTTDGLLHGVTAAPGLAVGPAFVLRRQAVTVPRDGRDAASERAVLDAALAQTRSELATGRGAAREIMEAHLALLDDPVLTATAEVEITAGRSAAFAWGAALDSQAEALDALADPRLRERAADLRDVKRRVQIALGGVIETAMDLPSDAILLADDLLPSELVELGTRIAGFCTARGGPTSHVAIIAASLGTPAVVAVGDGLLGLADGTEVILDADAARLDPAPATTALAAAHIEVAARAAARTAALSAAAEPCRMADGTRIEVAANLEQVSGAAPAVANGAESCGLLRTEFLFMDRPAAPDEAEQRATYQAIADALDGRPLIVRTLDIGADKPVAYLPAAPEDNPALGLRGVRLSLARPDLLRTQLRAILGVTSAGRCRIMAPMVSDLSEFRAVRTMLDALRAEMGVSAPVELGVMVETPAAAMIAAELAVEADFLSIGTNDLTQYVLAMDRTNPAVAAGIDALHPAVLRLIALTCSGGAKAGKWVGVCGGLASEIDAAPLLIGLGVTELSAAPAAIPALKAAIRPLTLERCRALAEAALKAPTAAEVRRLLTEVRP